MKYLIKGDISGIQEFIFNVSSKKAARTLKLRSYIIHLISQICVDRIKKDFPNANEISSSGGNFFIEVEADELDIKAKIKKIQDDIDQDLYMNEFHLILAYSIFDINAFKQVNKKSNAAKLQKFQFSERAFIPFITESENRNISFDIIDRDSGYNQKFLGVKLKDKLNKDKQLILDGLPIWTNELIQENKYWIDRLSNDDDTPQKGRLISFEQLSEFAKLRTGTSKIGVLKIDIDNLSDLFEKCDFHSNRFAQISKVLAAYFNMGVQEIAENIYGNDQKDKAAHLSQNIYTVFSNGDDCFYIGAWDSIFEFAKIYQECFTSYVKQQATLLLPEGIKTLTISAALDMFDAHHSMVRLAETINDQLDNAKKHNHHAKNTISFLGQCISWADFAEIHQIKDSLFKIINNDKAAKSLLQRIQDCAIEFNILQKGALRKEMNIPKIWKLYHYLRNIENDRTRQKIQTLIVQKYEDALMAAYMHNLSTDPVIYPLAARWTEFLTRKTN